MEDNNNYKISGLHLFNLFGFEVKLDWTWFFLALLISWTLAVGYFPAKNPGLSIGTYWLMGIIGAIGLFGSIILHEFCHALVGRIYGIPITGITLFIFGGLAEMNEEPPSPKAEFFMAIAGPLMSLGLGIVFYVLYLITANDQSPTPFSSVVGYLSLINFVVAIFNLLPGFPLDGGRVLRSLIWWRTGNLNQATQITSQGGTWLGYILIILGLIQFIQGTIISGLWMFLIGFFLQAMAKMSYRQLFIKELFRGEAIGQYVKKDIIIAPADMTVQTLVDTLFYQHYHKLYPVCDQGELIGSISVNKVGELDRQKWSIIPVKQVMNPNLNNYVIDKNTDVITVLKKMQNENIGRYIVTDQGKLFGMITRKDIMKIISLKLSLEKNQME